MAENFIKYRSGYKYQLAEDYRHQLPWPPPNAFDFGFLSIDENGLLIIRKDYAWDGPSGPTIDTKNFLRGSLVHDALYQAIRLGALPKTFKDKADRELKRICQEDGMTQIRAGWVYQGVKYFGAGSTRPSGEKQIQFAP